MDYRLGLCIATVLFTVAATPAPAPTPVPDPCGSIMSIVTRPTVTTGVCTVRDGRVDVENGFTNTTTTGSGGGQTVNYPQSFVRLGIAHNAEINFTPPSYSRSSVGGSVASGGTDMAFGAKWELGYTDKASWGAGFNVSAPTGSPAFTAGSTQYSALFNGSYALSSIVSVAGTVSFNALSGANAAGIPQTYGTVNPSLVLAATLPANSEVMAEYAYFSHAGPGVGGKSIIDFAYIHDLGEHVQLDVEYGFQPTLINGQRTHYVGAGISFMN